MPGAFDDVEILTGPNPKDPSNDYVLIRNNNRSKTVAANFRVTAPRNVPLLRLNRAAFNLFPHEAKLVIEAGQSQLIGCRHFVVVKAVMPTVEDRIPVSYTLQGAVYVSDEPQPPTLADADQYISMYEVPNTTGYPITICVYAVNMNHQFSASLEIVNVKNSNEGFGPELGLFEGHLAHAYPAPEGPKGWAITRAKFRKVAV